LLTHRPEVAAVAQIREIPMVEPRSGIEIRTRVVDGPLDQFAYAVPEGRAVSAPAETTLGRGAMEALGVGIGDRVQLRAAGQLVSLRVVGRYVEPDGQGRGAVIPRQGLPDAVVRLGGPFWVARLHAGADSAAVARALRSDSAGRLGVERPIESLQREAADIRPVVYGTTLLLLAIAFVNLLTTLLISIRERERDFAILASIGASPRQVLATVVSGGSLLALAAALVGLPLGTWMFLFMIGVTDPADGPDVGTLPSWWWFPLVLPAALALTALVSLLAARQATRIQPAPALRAE
jgi:putative ABC transport system permease protein